MSLLEHALTMQAAGLAVIPVRPDGSKAPAVNWRDYQNQPPDPAQLTSWFGQGSAYDGLGVVCGNVSGNLEMLELEGRAAHLVIQLAQKMAAAGHSTLWGRIASGYLERSPSGGLHWLYRVDGPARPNTKLARQPNPDNPKLVDVLIETRGEGGFTVTAPSGGRSHPTGKPWLLLTGTPASIPTITVDERDALHHVCTLFDQMPAIDNQPRPSSTAEFEGTRPGDDWNARASWDDILTPHGWTRTKSFGGGAWGWTRPGKHPRDGISATTGRNDGDNLFVFTSSTEFDTEQPYSKFAAYALLEHGGDYTAAARQLRADGYGSEPHRPVASPPAAAGAVPGDPFGFVPPPQIDSAAPQLATVTPLPERHLQVVEERTLRDSDDGNGLALIAAHGDQLRHCADRGRWYAWDGHRWAECPRNHGRARELAKRVARGFPERNDRDVAFKRKALSAVGITNMLAQAATDERVAVSYSQLDAHPWELNTPGGIVDLRTGKLRPPDPARLHTRSTLCTPDPAADRTAWLQFLTDTFNDDQELIDYLQRLIGYSAVGIVGSHVLPFCHGSGGNGKGVFLEANVKVLGDYATTAPAGFLMAKQHAAHETEIARLSGQRMVLCSEVNEGDRFDEAKVKALTGGDTITARFMAQDHFSFTPTHQLWLMGNSQPDVRSGGRSFWRRLRLIPFQREVPITEEVDDLQGILAREHGPAILSWIIEGAVAYHQRGLGEPPTVTVATAEYAREQDTVTQFLEEACLIGGGEHVALKVAIVRSAYEKWCAEAGLQALSAKSFGISMTRAGIGLKRTKAARFYTGIALLTEEPNASPESQPDEPEQLDWYR